LLRIRAERADVDHRFHRLAGEVHSSDMPMLAKRCVDMFRRKPQYEVVFQNTATHATVDHERKPTEHVLFGKFDGTIQDRPNAVGEMSVVRHRYSG